MPDYDEIEYPELPRGWQWASGTTSHSYYTHHFETEYQRGGDLIGLDNSLGGFSGEVYWDEGNKHVVQIRPITSIREDGDSEYGYASITREYDTMQEAVNAVPSLIRLLKKRNE